MQKVSDSKLFIIWIRLKQKDKDAKWPKRL